MHDTYPDSEGRFLYIDTTMFFIWYLYVLTMDFSLSAMIFLFPHPSSLRVRSPTSSHDLQTIPTLLSLIKQFTLCDPWRTLNPSMKDFTFYSHAHEKHSRIDFFLISSNLFPQVKSTELTNIIISNHAPVSLSILLGLVIPKSCNWSFPSYFSTSDDFCIYVKTHWSHYVYINIEHSDNTE